MRQTSRELPSGGLERSLAGIQVTHARLLTHWELGCGSHVSHPLAPPEDPILLSRDPTRPRTVTEIPPLGAFSWPVN